jgi:hypothetical protein
MHTLGKQEMDKHNIHFRSAEKGGFLNLRREKGTDPGLERNSGCKNESPIYAYT